MGLPAKQIKLSVEEYLELERKATEKNEFVNGEIYAMTGTTRKHNLISGNIFAFLHTYLKSKPCRVYMADLRVQVSSTDMIAYPDLVITCGEERLRDSHKDTLLNPKCIIEVLSPSTESYDRGEKFSHYQKLESLEEYILVSQDKYRVESYTRDGNRWIYRTFEGLSSELTIFSVEANLSLETIYYNTKDIS